jgi:hypothetical protein
MATGWYVPRVAELADQFDLKKVPTRTEDILELHNVQQYLEHGFSFRTLTMRSSATRPRHRFPRCVAR